MGKNSKAGKKTRTQRKSDRLNQDLLELQRDIEKDYAKHMHPAVFYEAFLVLMSLSCMVLHDWRGFGKKRLNEFCERLLDLLDSIQRPELVTIDDIMDELTRMTGLRYALTKEEADTLTYYGLKGLLHEVQFSAEQKEYWADRRARGWISNENRYGQIVR